MMFVVVCPPGLQTYVPPPDAVSVVDCPLHIVVFPEIDAVGVSMVTVTTSVFVPQDAVMLNV